MLGGGSPANALEQQAHRVPADLSASLVDAGQVVLGKGARP
jgi:hypothetical protein